MPLKTRLLMFTIAVMALAAAAPAAHADDGEMVLDLADTFIWLGEVRNDTDKGIDSRYSIHVKGLITGPIDTADRVRVEWKASGKVLSTIECDVQGSDREAPFSCRSDEGKQLDHHGALQAVLWYVDDSEDKVIPLYTMNLKVARFWHWYQRGKKTLHYPKFQIDHSDLLGSAIAWHHPVAEFASVAPVEIYTTAVVGEDGGGEWGTETFRCVAAGKKLPDVRSGVGSMQLAETIDWRGPDAAKHVVIWKQMRVAPTGFRWGTSAKLTDDEQRQHKSGDLVLLGDHPGDWSCDLRRKGKVLRTFTFTVGADGRIADHPEQGAGLRLLRSEAMVSVSFPDEAWDAYFDPARVKAVGFFGRPWALSATSAAMKLAKAKGPLEPAAPKGAKGGTAVKGGK